MKATTQRDKIKNKNNNKNNTNIYIFKPKRITGIYYATNVCTYMFES